MHAERNDALTRCSGCGNDKADGLDEHGHRLCPRCAGRLRGDREGESRGLARMLGAAVAAAMAEGLPEGRVREVVEAEIAAGGER